MGQTRAAIAYGILLDEAKKKEVDDKLKEPEYGEWKKGVGKNEPNANCGMTDRFNVLGFVVAVDGDADEHPGARADIPDLPLGNPEVVEELLGKKYIEKGRKKWETFAAWAKKHGVELSTPTLILTEVETA